MLTQIKNTELPEYIGKIIVCENVNGKKNTISLSEVRGDLMVAKLKRKGKWNNTEIYFTLPDENIKIFVDE